MGPNGPMTNYQREKYLAGNLKEHDEMLKSPGYQANQANAPSGLDVLNNNPSKAYFNNAGIAGSAVKTPGGATSKGQPGSQTYGNAGDA